MEDSGSLSIGQRIQLYRERSGKTRAVLGGLVGKSAEWVKAVERDRLLPPRLPMLTRIAGALRVQLADLVGQHEAELQQLASQAHPALPLVRSALNEVSLAPVGDPVPLAELTARVSAAWRTRHRSPDHRTAIGQLLPDLIRDSRTAVRAYAGDDRRAALVATADVMGLAQMYLAYQPAAELLWRVADRAMTAAEESGDPHAIGLAAWFLVEALRDAGDWDTAMQVNTAALDVVEPHLETAGDDLAAMYGSLHTVAALTAARAGDEGLAWRHWDAADRVVQRLPEAYAHPRTWFSDAVVGFYATSIAVELRRGGEAVRQAERVAPERIRSRPRRARHLVEVARAYHLRGDAAATVATLRAAHEAAPETVGYNGHARLITRDLLDREPALRRDVSDLATKIGL